MGLAWPLRLPQRSLQDTGHESAGCGGQHKITQIAAYRPVPTVPNFGTANLLAALSYKTRVRSFPPRTTASLNAAEAPSPLGASHHSVIETSPQPPASPACRASTASCPEPSA
jgi:hypothetical protein